ncbi:MAG: ADP-forming succinate--CoA ligase subunit beta [Candidatus Kapabacteria bacterium]|nr:ADP-forming succinate--CoA ligase subunit beta [Candidatus Kapabacteria bacterium]MDW8012594.1 ADP-forming succinate--CoA ligase subunit beta [Bacteroidota bacterium]
MNLHEFQAKELLQRYGVPIPLGRVVRTAEEAGAVTYRDFVLRNINAIVVKAQIHAGGRGKGQFVHAETGEPLTWNGEPLRGVVLLREGNIADKAYRVGLLMLGNRLVTAQTGPAGRRVRYLLLEEALPIAQELYVSITLDRSRRRPLLMVSGEGGVEIETIAAERPSALLREHIHPFLGLQAFQARRIAFWIRLEGELIPTFTELLQRLAHAYDELECSLLELNPLVRTQDGRFIALDAKVSLDDNALFRHPDLAALRDTEEEDPREVEASQYHLSYVKLDGNVGCMVNGAGLAMATMDMIQLAGGRPANFLDVGGAANVERIAHAFRIMLSDPDVRVALVNIFGGIVRCDRVAQGIVQALQQIEPTVPIVVRLEGTNAEEAAQILHASGLRFRVARSLEEATAQVREALQEAGAQAVV